MFRLTSNGSLTFLQFTIMFFSVDIHVIRYILPGEQSHSMLQLCYDEVMLYLINEWKLIIVCIQC